MMKKTYESPCLSEMAVGTEDVMLFSGDVKLGGNDPFGGDKRWGLF